MNNRKRMIARAQKRNQIKQVPGPFSINDFADVLRKLGNAMRTLATSAEKVIKAMDWSKLAKHFNVEEKQL